MRKSKFTEQQIVYAVKQAEAGVPVAELSRKGEVLGLLENRRGMQPHW
jgi:hypothetical protein